VGAIESPASGVRLFLLGGALLKWPADAIDPTQVREGRGASCSGSMDAIKLPKGDRQEGWRCDLRKV
jgi:hypothetical protein